MVLDRVDAGRAVFLKHLANELKSMTEQGRRHVLEHVAPGERVNAILPDGTLIGTVAVGNPSQSARVTDERALLEWVKANKPTEIMETVRPAYVDALKASAKKYGHAVDEPTGEIIPGVEVVEGSPSYLPRVNKDAEPLLRQRLADLSNGLLGLPGGSDA